jgi:NAD(P)-dependent dehydrogenase (short-subunit alcohol dehydrogenase family)
MTDKDDNAMNGYFNMMRQFLETQERVMSMYMRSTPGAQPSWGRVPAERVLEAAPLPPRPPAIAPPPRREARRPVAAPSPEPPLEPPVAAPQPEAAPKKGGALDREALVDLLLQVVEDKTGYPRDMVELNQNLESELGIDSIKRVEVATAILEQLPESYRAALQPSLGELNTQATLDGMLGIIGSVNGKETALPFDRAEAGAEADTGHPPRYVMVAREQPIPSNAVRRLRTGHFVVTDDTLGLAAALADRLVEAGCTVSRVPRELLGDEAKLSRFIAGLASTELAGVVHLAPVGSPWIEPDAGVDVWRDQLFINEKALFVLLRDLDVAADGHVLAATGLGGVFGRAPGTSRRGFSLQGGAVGLLKSVFEERPGLRVKAVDLDLDLDRDLDPERDRERDVAELASALLCELSLVGGRHEVGYPQGRRTAFHSVPTPATAAHRATGKQVVIATGGGRGVTAEVLRQLAHPGNVLILTGRRARPEEEPPAVAAASSAAELRNLLIEEVRGGRLTLKPAEIGRRVREIVGGRELQQNIADFERRGATVEYHAVDVTDEASLGALVTDVRERFGTITGVLHGAGIIEDKRLADKTSDSWSRVVETKVIGLALLQKLLPLEGLAFFAVMSSVAGRYGNSGQTDYATANELMNRLCCQLRDQPGAEINAMALCWGPWGPTAFGEGMVNAATEAKFADKGVRLVSAAMGQRLFTDELCRQDVGTVEVICGAGPWEEHETEVGAIETEAVATMGALLGPAAVEALPKGERVVTFSLGDRHAFLDAHRIDGVRVLPAAAAVELFAEAGAALWPGWTVVAVRDCRMLKGIDLQGTERTLQIEVGSPGYGSSDGFDVTASLRSEGGRVHYRCALRLQQHYDEAPILPLPDHDQAALTAAHVYDGMLFHGPCFQLIERVDGLSRTGGRALAHRSDPVAWLGSDGDAATWLFDPGLLDTAPQMAIVWARTFLDTTPLPSCFGRVVRYRDALPEQLRMLFELMPTPNVATVRANVYWVDEEDRVVMLVEDLEGIATAALNRLAGAAAPADVAVGGVS